MELLGEQESRRVAAAMRATLVRPERVARAPRTALPFLICTMRDEDPAIAAAASEAVDALTKR